MTYELCDCESRPEAHWKFDEYEDWMMFTITRAIFTSAMKRDHPVPEGTSGTVALEGNTLLLLCLNSLWHVGALQDDPEMIRRVHGEFELRPWTDFAGSWRCARPFLQPHPEHEGVLWHPRLEEVRRIECEEGGCAIVLPERR